MTMTGDKIYFSFDPFEKLGLERPKSGVREIKREMAAVLHDAILEYVENARSPVSGGGWKKTLSKEYKKRKVAAGGEPIADMELTGAMLDGFNVLVNRNGEIEVRVSGSKQAAKADGHNNHSGSSSLPERRFIPEDDQFFKQAIKSRLKDIYREYNDG